MEKQNINIENIIKENNELKLKLENLKEYKKNYYQNKTKNKLVFCVCCNENVKAGSYSNHIISKKHNDKKNKLNENNEIYLN